MIPRPSISTSENLTSDLRQQVTLGIFDRLAEAEAAARDLQDAGFSHEALSLVYKRSGSTPEVGAEETQTNNGMVAGASAGVLLGGALGLVALAIPGIGPILAAGPIAAAISGALAGGTLGGLIGSFAGLGVPTDQAKQYEEAVRHGGVVLSVKEIEQQDLDRATAILTSHHARGVATFTPAL